MNHPVFGILTIPLLAAVLRSQDPDTRPAESTAGQKSGEELKVLLGDGMEEGFQVRLQAIARLMPVRAQVFTAATEMLVGDNREVLIRIRQLVESLADERWRVREEAEAALGQIGHRARSLIEKAKGHPLQEVRIRVERILKELDKKKDDEELVITRRVRVLAEAAAYFGDPHYLKPLLAAAGHPNERVREAAASSLGVLGLPEAVPALVRLVEEPTLSLRNTAVTALAMVQAPAATEALARLATDKERPTSLRVLATVGLRGRPDGAQHLTALAADPVGPVRLAATAQTPAAGEPPACKVTLLDGTVLDKSRLRALRGPFLAVDGSQPGLAEVLVNQFSADAIEFEAQPAESGPTRMILRDGSILSGRLESILGGEFSFRSPNLGLRKVRREDVQGVAFDPKLDRLIGSARSVDRVRLLAGGALEGELKSATAEQITVTTSEGDQTAATATLSALLLKTGDLLVQPATGDHLQMVRVDLPSGERVTGFLVGASTGGFVLASAMLGSVEVPIKLARRLQFGVSATAVWGYTLISDYGGNKILEVDADGKVTLQLEDIPGPWDARFLESGNLLITEYGANRVREVTRDGKTVWSFSDLKSPFRAQRLPNGNTLIADGYNNRVIEVDPPGKIVWEYAQDIRPFDAERLPSGNTLIADHANNRVIEVNRQKQIVWFVDKLDGIHDADRLPNGNTLVTLRGTKEVLELDRAKKVVFSLKDLQTPSDAERLPNGNTLVAEYQGVREFDRFGKVVWQKEVEWASQAQRY